MKEMIITIDKLGNITVDTEGFTGDECTEETKKLEDELGIVSNRDRKPDYYRKARITRTTKVSR